MTTVKFRKYDKTLSVRLNGHADSAKNGEADRVCASESAYIYQLAQAVMNMYEEDKLLMKPFIILSPGDAAVKCSPKPRYKKECELAFKFCYIGFQLLQKGYPLNVRIK